MGKKTKQFRQRKHQSHRRAMRENGDSPTDFSVFLEGCGPLLIRVWLRITHRDAGYKVGGNNLNFDATTTMTRFYEHKKTN